MDGYGVTLGELDAVVGRLARVEDRLAGVHQSLRDAPPQDLGSVSIGRAAAELHGRCGKDTLGIGLAVRAEFARALAAFVGGGTGREVGVVTVPTGPVVRVVEHGVIADAPDATDGIALTRVQYLIPSPTCGSLITIDVVGRGTDGLVAVAHEAAHSVRWLPGTSVG